MTETKKIEPVSKPVHGTIRPPGSKSITNRALICAALADGESILTGALDSEDTQVMIDSLKRLGISVKSEESAQKLVVHGCGGKIPAADADLYIANSGTSVRFLTALAALGRGRFRLAGTARMHQRPIADLLEGLADLGVELNSEAGNGCPPVVVHAGGIPGGRASVAGDISSQFLSALLMVAPYAQKQVELVVEGELVSQPYVRMTLAVMRSFGVDIPEGNLQRFAIPQALYRGQLYTIEPDASAASYFFAAAAITGGEVTVAGLSREALQGDVAFVDVLEQMGCRVTVSENPLPPGEGRSPQATRRGEVRVPESITVTGPAAGKKLRGITVNMNAISDTVQTLAAVALFADGPTTITGVGHIRHKETDRIGNLAIELRKFGATVEELSDGLKITPPAAPSPAGRGQGAVLPLPPGEGRGEGAAALRGAQIATYNDHRMAMSLALVGLKVPGVVIEDPKCVEKTYPRFFEDLEKLVGQ